MKLSLEDYLILEAEEELRQEKEFRKQQKELWRKQQERNLEDILKTKGESSKTK